MLNVEDIALKKKKCLVEQCFIFSKQKYKTINVAGIKTATFRLEGFILLGIKRANTLFSKLSVNFLSFSLRVCGEIIPKAFSL